MTQDNPQQHGPCSGLLTIAWIKHWLKAKCGVKVLFKAGTGQRLWRSAAWYWLASQELISLLSYIFHDYLPRGGIGLSGQGLPTSITNQQISLRLIYQTIWWRKFSTDNPSSHICSVSCQVDKNSLSYILINIVINLPSVQHILHILCVLDSTQRDEGTKTFHASLQSSHSTKRRVITSGTIKYL